MKHLLSICCLFIIASPVLSALPFTKILLKPEYQVATTLDGPLFFTNEKEDEEVWIEYTFISESEVSYQVIEFDLTNMESPKIISLTAEYTTDYDEANYQLSMNKVDQCKIKLTLDDGPEYILLSDGNGWSFSTSYPYPDSWGEYKRDEIIIIRAGVVEIIE